MSLKPVKIFLASSSELKEDRVAFELEIGRRNHSWIQKGLYLQLMVWEDFIDAMSQERLQSEYNKAIEQCDIFVMLFFTKVGKYTAEEFEVAFKSFKATNRPIIYTYFKDALISTGNINAANAESVAAFKTKLGDLGHFYTTYQNTEGLLLHFLKQLDKLMDNGFFNHQEAPTTATSEREENIAPVHNETPPPADSLSSLQAELKRKTTNMPKLFDELTTLLKSTSERYNDLVALSARYHSAESSFNRGMIGFEEMSRGFNRVRVGVLALIDDLEGEDLKAAHRPAGGAIEVPARRAESRPSLSEIERSSLEGQKDLIEEKLAYFRQELLVSADPDTKFGLKKKIQNLESELATVMTKLNGEG